MIVVPMANARVVLLCLVMTITLVQPTIVHRCMVVCILRLRAHVMTLIRVPFGTSVGKENVLGPWLIVTTKTRVHLILVPTVSAKTSQFQAVEHVPLIAVVMMEMIAQ